MWKILSTAHSSVWLCLLGSGLSLIAFFFLPYATSTSETLGECLTSCALDRGYPSYSFRFQPVPWGIGTLLLLLLGIIVLAFLALPLRSLRWKSTTLYLRLTSIALSYYLGAVIITISFGWVIVTTSSDGGTLLDLLSSLGIGAWLVPAGLSLALLGGIFLKRWETQTSRQLTPARRI